MIIHETHVKIHVKFTRNLREIHMEVFENLMCGFKKSCKISHEILSFSRQLFFSRNIHVKIHVKFHAKIYVEFTSKSLKTLCVVLKNHVKFKFYVKF